MGIIQSQSPINRSAAHGEDEAQKLLHAVSHGVAGFGALYDSMCRAAQIDGQPVPESRALRRWAESLQTALRMAMKR